MGSIKGTIVVLKDFMFDTETSIKTEYQGELFPTLIFKKGRILFVPNYQREIRWEKETLFSLMNDIYHGGKFLGNIILSSCGDKNYEIIDGQQRLVSLNMLILYIKQNYPDQSTDIGAMVPIEINCFEKYDAFQRAKYKLSNIPLEQRKSVMDSDKLKQADSLEILYDSISQSEIIGTPEKARVFFDNLRKCTLNVIVSNDDDRKISTEYYIDVNLKGIKLDTEDIFKGYLFAQDSSDTIRNLWVTLKQKWLDFNMTCNCSKDKSIYSLMKILEHYIYCFLLSKSEYSGIIINENFCLEASCEINNTKYYVGDHVIKAVNNNTYMQQVINGAIEYVAFLTEVVSTDGVPAILKKMLAKVDNTERKIICNIIKKTILDKSLLLPKLLILKYYLNILSGNESPQKYKEIYAIYFFNVMFMLFGNKKSDSEKIRKIARSTSFYPEIMASIHSFFENKKVMDSKMMAISRWNSNYNNEELQYKCKSLATIYNYFKISNKTVIISSCDEVNSFLSNEDLYSVEHFIINHSGTVKYKDELPDYELPGNLKSYGSYIFNFIFIPKELNRDTLKNYSLQDKLKTICTFENINSIKCEYSKMIVEQAKERFTEEVTVNSLADQENENLEKYWLVTFKREYNSFVSAIIEKIIERFTSAKD